MPEFYGPDGVRSMYLDANGGSGPRRRTVATDVGEDLTAAETAITALESSSLTTDDVTAVGDLLAGTGLGTVARVGVGGDGMLLVADSLQATGVRWGRGGGAGTSRTRCWRTRCQRRRRPSR
ncbi:hypothetical protein [Streptomyces sp. C8S0]|uniref:hypothetical protein n=1 Tax=Streptomyces sp. C8S0 TaxID=2585716 RepID=UPI00125D5E1B|nr:hypothetical protein [Streptomyces sp. C8S0]